MMYTLKMYDTIDGQIRYLGNKDDGEYYCFEYDIKSIVMFESKKDVLMAIKFNWPEYFEIIRGLKIEEWSNKIPLLHHRLTFIEVEDPDIDELIRI